MKAIASGDGQMTFEVAGDNPSVTDIPKTVKEITDFFTSVRLKSDVIFVTYSIQTCYSIIFVYTT
ncbi:MAG: hypothetical protein IPJ30_20630 [Acidobacteria bacterium]|nr:hypothetical protein [Acidobacteriota bacterium]